jgi:LPXTG-motif cell wall-anchored protein
MKLFKGIGTGLCITVLCLLVAPNAKADQFDRKTLVTFSGPVEVPGVGAQVLPAGTYIFKVLDSPSDRHIVQILSRDGNHVFTTILAIPNFRLKTTDKTVITFRERPAGEPEALKAWFYPGREWGDQFVYDKPTAMLLAKETNETVLWTPAILADAPAEALNAAPVEAVNPNGETVDTGLVVEAPPVIASAVAPTGSLPKTASDLSLIGLVGLLSLGGGFLLFTFSKLKS